MAKPKRTFSADVGQRSVGAAGPDQIEYDLDNLFAALDPNDTFKDGSPGGITTENMRNNAVTDAILGNRTVDQAIADPESNTGTLTQLLSWIVKHIKAVKGNVTNWYDAAASSISALWAKFHATTGHKHTGAENDAPKIDHADLLNKGLYTHAQLDQHVDATAPHTGHETPAGAQAKVDTHAGLASGVHGVGSGAVVGTTLAQTLTDKTLGAGTALGADLNAGGYRITNVGAPTAASDAARKDDLDVRSVYPAVATTLALPSADPVGALRVVLNKGDGSPGLYKHNGNGNWSLVGTDAVTDHGMLTGLLDDDHPQYALDTDLDTVKGVGWAGETVKGVSDALNTHLADNANPHKVKAEQVFALGGVPAGTAFPTSPAPYTLFFRTDLNKLFVYLP